MKWITIVLVALLHYQCGQSFRLLPLGHLNEKMMSISTQMASELDDADILELKLALLQAINDMKRASLKQLLALGNLFFKSILYTK